MRAIEATAQVSQAEVRLEWLLAKLHRQSLGRRSRLAMPVLIGGTALRRAYRLTRPSTDLDFAVADAKEMDRLLNAATMIAGERWPGAKVKLREDNEQGWRIDDSQGQTVLHIGGIAMSEASLELALWVRETWTLPIARLAAMKVKAGTELRSKVRDLYDMGFIAEHYPGDVTPGMAEKIEQAGWDATRPANRWTQDHDVDQMLRTQDLAAMGRDVARAAQAALAHIEGARQGRWANQSSVASDLQEAVESEPHGTWRSHNIDERAECMWRAPDGNETWRAIIENEARVRSLLMQANVDGHPHMRKIMEGNSSKREDRERQRPPDSTIER